MPGGILRNDVILMCWAKQGLLDLSGCQAWLKLVFCVTLIPLFIIMRLSGEATAVVKFIIGRSRHPENCAHEHVSRCSE